jgi:hypothetical protein
VNRKSLQAGLWMAGPICLKVFPVFLLIYPLLRRDFRCLAGCALGLILGIAVIPGLVFGPKQSIDYYAEYADLVLLPGMGAGKNQDRADTLTAITATDTQSFMAMMHNALYPDIDGRPAHPSSLVRTLHWGIGLILTLVVCLAAGLNGRRSPDTEALCLGLLAMLMMLLSPVCHLAYFAWMLPAVMVLLLRHWEKRRDLALGFGWGALLIVNNLAHALAHMNKEFAVLQLWRDLGMSTYVALGFFAAGLIALRRARSVNDNVSWRLPATVRLSALRRGA